MTPFPIHLSIQISSTFQAFSTWRVFSGDCEDNGDRLVCGTGGAAGAVLRDGNPGAVPARVWHAQHSFRSGHKEAAVSVYCENGTGHGYCIWNCF